MGSQANHLCGWVKYYQGDTMEEIKLSINKIRCYLKEFAEQEKGNKLSEFSMCGLGTLIEEQLMIIEEKLLKNE